MLTDTYGLLLTSLKPVQGHTTIDVSSLFSDGSNSLLLYDTSVTPPIPIPLRTGDLDLDGFPDLVPLIVQKDNSVTPHILISKPCAGGRNGCHGNAGRTFERMSRGTDALTQIRDARAVALLDLDEDVRRATHNLVLRPV